MSSSRQWTSFLHWWVRRSSRLAEAQRFIDATSERYLDADLWAGMRGIPKDEARKQLEAGVEMRLLEKCLLYEWPDSPVRFLVPASQVGQAVRLADVGYIGEDDNREILISANRVRTVFVSAGAGEF